MSEPSRSRRRHPRRHKPRDEAARVLKAPALQIDAPTEQPLSAAELRELKAHLKLLLAFRKELRLKVNAAEDLLLNGAREPDDRGVVAHLLGKVDLGSVQTALERIDDPSRQRKLLAGVARFSTDLGVLLLYLEHLHDEASRRVAAGALALAVERMDFASASPARLRRVLELFVGTFEGHERVQAFFGLLSAPGFATALEELELPRDLERSVQPLLAVRAVVIDGDDNPYDLPTLQAGCALLLDAPTEALASWPEEVRLRLIERAVPLVLDAELADRAATALLETLPRDGEPWRRLALERAGALMGRQQDNRARWLLDQLRKQLPGDKQVERLQRAIQGKRLGRVVPERGDAATRRGLQRGLWLDQQQPVWLRTESSGARQAMEAQCAFQHEEVLPGVAPLLTWGVADKGISYAVMPSFGRPLDDVLKRGLPLRASAVVALQAAQILASLGNRGATLPDASAARFLVDKGPSPWLLLADLAGLRVGDPSKARRRQTALVFRLSRELMQPHEEQLPGHLLRTLASKRATPPELVSALGGMV